MIYLMHVSVFRNTESIFSRNWPSGPIQSVSLSVCVVCSAFYVFFLNVLFLLFTKVESQIDRLPKDSYREKVMKLHWSHIKQFWLRNGKNCHEKKRKKEKKNLLFWKSFLMDLGKDTIVVLVLLSTYVERFTVSRMWNFLFFRNGIYVYVRILLLIILKCMYH